MKRKVLIAVSLLTLFLTGCNKQMVDLTYKYNRAIVELPGEEVIYGEIDSWTDFEDGDQIQVKMDGVTYLVHSSNIALIAD